MLYDAYNDNGKADIGKMGNILTVAEQIKGYSLSNDFESIFQGAGQETKYRDHFLDEISGSQ